MNLLSIDRCSEEYDPHFPGASIFWLLFFSEFNTEGKTYRSGLMAKVVAGKMPLRKFSLWGIAFPRGTGNSHFGVCPLDQSRAHPSLAASLSSCHCPCFWCGSQWAALQSSQKPFTLWYPGVSGPLSLLLARELRNSVADDDPFHEINPFLYRELACPTVEDGLIQARSSEPASGRRWVLQAEVSGKFHNGSSLEQGLWKLALTVLRRAENGEIHTWKKKVCFVTEFNTSRDSILCEINATASRICYSRRIPNFSPLSASKCIFIHVQREKLLILLNLKWKLPK